MSKTVYLCIGNSDDKLTQNEWSKFVDEINRCLDGVKRQGEWYSMPNSPYQNACWCLEVDEWDEGSLKKSIIATRKSYEQECVAWSTVERTEFI